MGSSRSINGSARETVADRVKEGRGASAAIPRRSSASASLAILTRQPAVPAEKSFEMLIAALYRPRLVRQKPQGRDRALEKVQGLRTLR